MIIICNYYILNLDELRDVEAGLFLSELVLADEVPAAHTLPSEPQLRGQPGSDERILLMTAVNAS